MRAVTGTIIAGLAGLALTACQPRTDSDRNIDALDNELTGANAAARDPAMLAALHDQIMVDPALVSQSNKDAIRPAPQPYSAPVPPDSVAAAGDAAPLPSATSEQLRHAPAPTGNCPQCDMKNASVTLAGTAKRQRGPRTADCVTALHYSAAWATRLPADLPLYADARVNEAAGAEGGGCHLRIVSFASATPIDHLIDWYYTKATAAGYSAEHQGHGEAHALGGTRGDDAYVIYLSPHAGGGTDVDLIANDGR